eukprot:159512-Rhodomonas_salina.1
MDEQLMNVNLTDTALLPDAPSGAALAPAAPSGPWLGCVKRGGCVRMKGRVTEFFSKGDTRAREREEGGWGLGWGGGERWRKRKRRGEERRERESRRACVGRWWDGGSFRPQHARRTCLGTGTIPTADTNRTSGGRSCACGRCACCARSCSPDEG